MQVLFVSECRGRAINETRRILDQFAERKGVRTWQTPITLIGVNTVRKLLAKTARKNTAVCCHWLKSGDRSEILWIVGKQAAFNSLGTVPTNYTYSDILRRKEENGWQFLESTCHLAALAGLFHDFGKASKLFQKKLEVTFSQTSKLKETFRHEWVSLLLFQQFVSGYQDDYSWLKRLTDPEEIKIVLSISKLADKPLLLLENYPVAKFVGWLILSHHKLPFEHSGDNARFEVKPQKWIGYVNADWNSHQEKGSPPNKDNLIFPSALPFKSKTWQETARDIASTCLKNKQLLKYDWFNSHFTLHLARLCLMFADHTYSASAKANVRSRDITYEVYANTTYENNKRIKNQQLDEHCIEVAQIASSFAKTLPKLREELPFFANHKKFRQRVSNEKFAWQDRAYEFTVDEVKNSKINGFFGVSLASTGSGKTLGNARIMYGLADETVGVRFTIALGLRTLTLQTAEILKNSFCLDDDVIGTIIGDANYKDLFSDTKNVDSDNNFQNGTESLDNLLFENQYLLYGGSQSRGKLGKWLKNSPRLNKLISSPILVSTVDQIIAATEGIRGGKQMVPLLRLLTSDLILDEVDDFGLEDLPALTRLVNYAGLFGSRVLISSATLPPSLVSGLFCAYLSGRRGFNASKTELPKSPNIVCAWFDERDVKPQVAYLDSVIDYKLKHQKFVDKRCSYLTDIEKNPIKRRAKIISTDEINLVNINLKLAELIVKNAKALHADFHVTDNATGVNASIGLVRFANIKALVAVARELDLLLKDNNSQDLNINFCVYHSRFPLLLRSAIEERLDRILQRGGGRSIFAHKEIIDKIDFNNKDRANIFIVLATSVAEVGRDHDYDWAIIEPSSWRSIIQLVGRVSRHRNVVTFPNSDSYNVAILNENIKSLETKDLKKPVFTRPGFEDYILDSSGEFRDNFIKDNSSLKIKLKSHKISELVTTKLLENLNSSARINSKDGLELIREVITANGVIESLVELEHITTYAKMQHGLNFANIDDSWPRQHLSWCGELQKRERFRKSYNAEYYLTVDEEGGDFKFYLVTNKDTVDKSDFFIYEFNKSSSQWFNIKFIEEVEKLSLKRDENFSAICRKFATFSLEDLDPNNSREKWVFNDFFGFVKK
jgi:CRISPR-associated endonuclease/helicase Cas3